MQKPRECVWTSTVVVYEHHTERCWIWTTPRTVALYCKCPRSWTLSQMQPSTASQTDAPLEVYPQVHHTGRYGTTHQLQLPWRWAPPTHTLRHRVPFLGHNFFTFYLFCWPFCPKWFRISVFNNEDNPKRPRIVQCIQFYNKCKSKKWRNVYLFYLCVYFSRAKTQSEQINSIRQWKMCRVTVNWRARRADKGDSV